jgi:arginine N-succinyltransferase
VSFPFLRPAKVEDLPTLIHFAEQAAFGITSLPRNKARLEYKIERSLSSFCEKFGLARSSHTFSEQIATLPTEIASQMGEDSVQVTRPRPFERQDRRAERASCQRKCENSGQEPPQIYLFCLEWENQVIGTAGIISRIGVDEPFYAFHLLHELLHFPSLGIERKIGVLHLTHARKKPTEIGTLFLSPKLRQKALGKLLSLSRFLFIASFRQRFAPTIIAELRGVNHNGISPFWNAVGRPFYQIDFPSADLLRSQHDKGIEALFPKHPLYIDLLAKEAQRVIGITHPDTQGALKILSHQGFKKSSYLDIFDAGPHLFAPTHAIHAVATSKLAQVCAITSPQHRPQEVLISNTRLDFRATQASILIEEQRGVILQPDVAKTLQVDVGDTIRYYKL